MHIRPATRADSADLAILDDVASSGLAAWLWSGAVARGEASSALERGRQRFAAGEGEISWRNASIAEVDGDVAGMSVSYPLSTVGEAADAPNAVLKPLYELLSVIRGHRYIDALAVYNRHRGRGIGRGLMRHELDRSEGAIVSLITEDDNKAALGLYRALGFTEVARRPCTKFSPKQTTREWVLLTRPATS
ncbi:GNAT family N-acetyltransferase [Hoeflea sp.]|uniref:GNAT family N-acetyltransferase n=1 Tax=Hoeflea sp. TaxID=1940281 RepID=UPI003BB10C2F